MTEGRRGASTLPGGIPRRARSLRDCRVARCVAAALRSRRDLSTCMGDSTPFPTPAAIARAELFTRERFVYEGEMLEDALAPGSARRRALDAALRELDGGARQPSIA